MRDGSRRRHVRHRDLRRRRRHAARGHPHVRRRRPSTAPATPRRSPTRSSSAVDRTPPDTPLNAAARDPDAAAADHLGRRRSTAGRRRPASTTTTSTAARRRSARPPARASRTTLVTLDGSYAYTVAPSTGPATRRPATPPLTVIFDKTPPPPATGLTAPTPTPDAPRIALDVGRRRQPVRLRPLRRLPRRQPRSASTHDADASRTRRCRRRAPHVYAVRTIDVAGNASARLERRSPSSTTRRRRRRRPASTIPTPTRLPHLTLGRRARTTTPARPASTTTTSTATGCSSGRSATTTFDDATVHAERLVRLHDHGGRPGRQREPRLAHGDHPLRRHAAAAAARSERRLADPAADVHLARRASDEATGGSAIASYRIYRNGAFVGETAGTSFTDANAVELRPLPLHRARHRRRRQHSAPSRGARSRRRPRGADARRRRRSPRSGRSAPRSTFQVVAARRARRGCCGAAHVGLRRRARDRQQASRTSSRRRRRLHDHGAARRTRSATSR